MGKIIKSPWVRLFRSFPNLFQLSFPAPYKSNGSVYPCQASASSPTVRMYLRWVESESSACQKSSCCNKLTRVWQIHFQTTCPPTIRLRLSFPIPVELQPNPCVHVSTPGGKHISLRRNVSFGRPSSSCLAGFASLERWGCPNGIKLVTFQIVCNQSVLAQSCTSCITAGRVSRCGGALRYANTTRRRLDHR